MEWKIGKSGGRCSACEGPLKSGEAFYSLLNEWEGGLERRDYCRDCWPKEQARLGGSAFFWRTIRATAPKKRAIDVDLVVELFKKVAGGEDQMRQKVCYFLALLLMRKKAVKLLSTGREDGREFMMVRLRGEESPRRVMNPDLTPGGLEEVKAELEAMLEMELSGE